MCFDALGGNNNPTTVQFTAGIKKLLLGTKTKTKYGNIVCKVTLDYLSYPLILTPYVDVTSVCQVTK